MAEKHAADRHVSVDLESGKSGISWWKLLNDQGVLTPEIVKWNYDGSGTEEDPYVVEWIENDPRNPMRWNQTRKWAMTLSMALATLTISFCSSAFSGGMSSASCCRRT
jgi:hypothetical protein